MARTNIIVFGLPLYICIRLYLQCCSFAWFFIIFFTGARGSKHITPDRGMKVGVYQIGLGRN
jgi:hypothetical protein